MNKIKTVFEHKRQGAIYDGMFHVVSSKSYDTPQLDTAIEKMA
jgi:hypothetical protein